MATGAVTIGSGSQVTVTMTRWHWRMLAFLDGERGVDIAAAFAEVQALAPEAPPDQIIAWYIEAAFDALIVIESEEERVPAENGAAGDSG